GKLDWEWLCAPLQRQGPARDQDPLRDRASVAQAHFRPIRRRGMRALGLRPILPVLHRRGVLPACVPARTLRPEPLEEAPWRQARVLLAESLRVAHEAGALRGNNCLAYTLFLHSLKGCPQKAFPLPSPYNGLHNPEKWTRYADAA